MSQNVIMMTLGGYTFTLYSALVALFSVGAFILTILVAPKFCLKGGKAFLFAFLSAVFGLFFGRAAYCAVNWEDMFLDELGTFKGLDAFYHIENGSLNCFGIIFGIIFAALLCALFTREKPFSYLDTAVLPGMLLYTFCRLVEPLSGKGYGDLIEDIPFLCRSPFGIMNEEGGWSLSVSFFEAAFGVIILLILLIVLKNARRRGTLSLSCMCLLPVFMIIPESLRRDGALMIIIFVRVTQLGFAVLLFFSLFIPLCYHDSEKRAGHFILELFLMLLGIALLVGGEFAIDGKISFLLECPTFWIYVGMAVVLLLLCVMTMRRILKEDKAVC